MNKFRNSKSFTHSKLLGLAHKHWTILFFALTLTLFGLLSLASTPPIGTTDEEQHFARAYQISEGDIVANLSPNNEPGFPLPQNVVSYYRLYHQKVAAKGILPSETELNQTNANQPASHQKTWASILGSSFYSPASYLPQTLGIKVGQLLNLSIKQTFYLGRLLNLIFYIVLATLAVYIVGKSLRWIYIVVLLNPISVQLAGSYSPDSQLLAALALILALVIYLSKGLDQNKNLKLNWQARDFWVICGVGILSIFIALQKQIYLVAVLPLLLASWSRLESYLSLKKIRLLKLSIAGLSILSIATWMLISARATANIPALQFGSGFSMSSQLKDLFTKPWDFIGSFFRTLTDRGALKYNIGGFGRIGWNVFLPVPWFMLLLITYLTTVWQSSQDTLKFSGSRLNSSLARILIADSLLSIAVIFVSLYLVATAKDSPIIAGLQGRYFFAPLLIGMAGSSIVISDKLRIKKGSLGPKISKPEVKLTYFIAIAVIMLNLITILSLRSAY